MTTYARPPLVADVDAFALATLEFLASQLGVQALSLIFDVMTGSPAGMVIAEDISSFAASLLQTVITAWGPDKTKAAIDAQFAAADRLADTAERAKFGPP